MRNPIRLLSILVYSVACMLPAFNGYSVPGFKTLEYGWLAVAAGEYAGLAWLANIFYLAGFLCSFNKIRLSFWLTLPAVILSLAVFLVKEIPVSEGGAMAAVSPGPGAWCWMGAIILLFIFCARLKQVSA